MRIAMIGQKGIPAIYGGVERHVHDLSVRLVEAGNDVTVYSRSWYTEGKDAPVSGVGVKLVPTIKTKHLDAIVHTLLSTIHAVTQKYDVIHYHAVGPSLLSWIPRIFAPKTKIVTTFHCVDRYHQKWNVFARFMLRLGERTACAFAHETITVSQSLKNYCENEYQADTTYIPNGVVIPKSQSDDALAQFGLERGKYLVMVSRLVKHKGAHILVDAFARLKKMHPENNTIQELKLAIVGGSAYTDEYVSELHTQAGTCNTIVFTGFQSGIALDQLYANATALVHPSMNEGLPITVLQAMSYARPALVSNIPEHLEVIKDIRAVYTENDVDALVENLENFLTLSQGEQKSMGESNKRVVERKYTWDMVVPQVIDVYERNTTRNKKVVPRQVVV